MKSQCWQRPAFDGWMNGVLILGLWLSLGLLSGCSSSSGVGSSNFGNGEFERIELLPRNPVIKNGEMQQFSAIGYFSDNTSQDITDVVTNWHSSAPSIATVSMPTTTDGLAQPAGFGPSEGVGETTITATFNQISGSTKLTVLPASLAVIDITPLDASIENGMTLQYSALGTYSDGTVLDVTPFLFWGSSNTTIMRMDNTPGFNGIAKTLQAGSIFVTATFAASVAIDQAEVSSTTSLLVTQTLDSRFDDHYMDLGIFE